MEPRSERVKADGAYAEFQTIIACVKLEGIYLREGSRTETKRLGLPWLPHQHSIAVRSPYSRNKTE